MSEWAKNAAAFASLAVRQRRLSLQARMRAADAGSDEEAQRHRNEARRLWRDAEWHDAEARHHLELGGHHG